MRLTEPGRTERLLAHPLQLRKANATDFLEAYQFPYMPLAGGTSRVSVYTNHLVLTLQLCLGILSGLGKAGVFNRAWARVQVHLFYGIQFSIFLYLWCLFPAHDRMDNLMFSAQFALEGTMTALLANQGEDPEVQASIQGTAFGLSLLALAVPLLRRFYDGVIVQCIKMRRKGPFNRKAAALAFTMFLLQLQGTLLKLIGIQSEGTGAASAVTENIAKLANREAAVGGGVMIDILESAGTMAAEAYAVIFGAGGVQPKHQNAATFIQKILRGITARKRVKVLIWKLTRAQAWARGMLARRLLRQHLAARMVQASVRGMISRRHTQAFVEVRRAAWIKPDECFGSRPGLQWVLRQEGLVLAKESLERIRLEHTQKSLPLASRLSFHRGPRLSFPRAIVQSERPRRPPRSLSSCTTAEIDPTAEIPDGDEDTRAHRVQHHSAVGVVFMKHPSVRRPTPEEITADKSLQVAFSLSRREIALAALPATNPPGFDRFGQLPTVAQLRLAARRDTIEVVWESYVKPVLITILGYGFLGTQTFPPRPKDQGIVSRRGILRQRLDEARKLESKKSKAANNNDEDYGGEGDGDGGD